MAIPIKKAYWGILMLLLSSCISNGGSVTIQELRPWHSAETRPIDEYFTTRHMVSRPPRHVVSLNRDWTFNYFPQETPLEAFTASSFDDTAWPAIAIPHTWQSYETTRQPHPFIMNASEVEKSYFGKSGGVGNVSYWYYGWGHYRKRFRLKKPIPGKRLFIEFEGVMKYCKVYLNGTYLGDHKGGFNAFYFDATPHLNAEGENVLTVAVNNRLDDVHRIPPMYSGNQTHSGGIYRDVNLVIKNEVHIPFQGSADHEGGTFVRIPQLNRDRATVAVDTYVRNLKNISVIAQLTTKIVGPNKEIIAEETLEKQIQTYTIGKFSQEITDIEQPQYWSVDHPTLYKVISEVRVAGELMDVYESPLGFRTFTWDKKTNWAFLNGQKIHIHGTNRTQAFPWVNNAIPDWIDIMDVRDIKFGQGHNFIRPNLHAVKPLMHDLFDQYGIMVNLANPNIKDIDFSEEVQKQIAVEAVRRHRNRPSIVMYEVGNETNDAVDSKWIYGEDSTKIITQRHVKAGAGRYITHDDTNMDMENLLRCTVRGWTDVSVFPENPEYNQHTGNEAFQHEMARVEGGSQRGRIDMHNGNMWMYCDDGAIRVYKNAPLNYVNPKGWVDLYRVPKYLYFLWQAHYYPDPMAFIHPYHWQPKYLGEEKDIVVDSNMEEVELRVGGKSYGTKKLDAANFHTATFKNVLVENKAVKVVARKGKQEIETLLPMAGAPRKLVLKTAHETLGCGRDNIAMITVDVVDEKGVQVQGFHEPINWQIEGPGKFLTPEEWTTDIHKRNADSGIWYIATPLSNFVRAVGEPGQIIIRASSEGLGSAKVTLIALVKEDNDPFIIQPFLRNKGREEVVWRPALEVSGTDNEQSEMQYVFKDFQLETGKAEIFYRTFFGKVIREENPWLSEYPKVVNAISEHFTQHVLDNEGLLVNDDYNLIVDKVNGYFKSVPGPEIKGQDPQKIISQIIGN